MGRSKTLATMKRFEAAEKDLLEAERILGGDADVPAGRHQSSLVALGELYEGWSKADPQGGHAARATEWKAKAKAGSAAGLTDSK